MAIDAVTAAQQAAQGAASAGRTRLAESFDTFLSLLTTQLKNQDPLSPLDSNQFTQQLVQMTGVEQQLLTNDLLKALVNNTSSGISTAVSLIGKEVRAVSAEAMLSKGKASWVYDLDAEAASVKLEVLDSKGRVVLAKMAQDNKAGDHAFVWDGKDNFGAKLPEGTYSLRVTASDSAGVTIASNTFVQGLVTGVEQADGRTYITVNGGKVEWDRVTSISQPAAPVTASNQNDPSNPDDEPSPPAGG